MYSFSFVLVISFSFNLTFSHSVGSWYGHIHSFVTPSFILYIYIHTTINLDAGRPFCSFISYSINLRPLYNTATRQSHSYHPVWTQGTQGRSDVNPDRSWSLDPKFGLSFHPLLIEKGSEIRRTIVIQGDLCILWISVRSNNQPLIVSSPVSSSSFLSDYHVHWYSRSFIPTPFARQRRNAILSLDILALNPILSLWTLNWSICRWDNWIYHSLYLDLVIYNPNTIDSSSPLSSTSIKKTKHPNSHHGTYCWSSRSCFVPYSICTHSFGGTVWNDGRRCYCSRDDVPLASGLSEYELYRYAYGSLESC